MVLFMIHQDTSARSAPTGNTSTQDQTTSSGTANPPYLLIQVYLLGPFADTYSFRHVRVHHMDKEKDDPQLRDVLAQRPEGGNRGRRRRLGS